VRFVANCNALCYMVGGGNLKVKRIDGRRVLKGGCNAMQRRTLESKVDGGIKLK